MRKGVITLGAVMAGAAAGFYVGGVLNRPRYSFRNRVVIITGGSRGLGLVLARQLVEKGAHVALLARSRSQLRRAEFELTATGARVVAIPCDVREQSQVNAAVSEVVRRFGRIDVLINNAGTMQVGPLDSVTVQDFEESMAVHLFGALYCALAVLPHMRRVGRGRIVNIASIGGRLAVPHMMPYCAGKFALVGFSEALGAELRRERIYVTTVCPGLMRTGSAGNALFKGDHVAEHTWFAVAASLPLLSVSAQRAGEKILAACARKTARLTISFPARAAAVFNELFPDATAAITAFVNKMLPHENASREAYTGWESASRYAPSFLTRRGDAAALRNNETPAR